MALGLNNSALGFKNPVMERIGIGANFVPGTEPVDYAATNRRAQETIYENALDQAKRNTALSRNALTQGYDAGIETMQGSGIGAQYDDLINQLMTGAGLDDSIAEITAAGAEAGGYIKGGADEAVRLWGIGADEATLALSTAFADSMKLITDFEATHTEKDLFDLGFSGFKDSVASSMQSIIGYAQSGGLSPAVINQMKQQWQGSVLDTGANMAANAVQQSNALGERTLGMKLDTTGGFSRDIAGVHEREGIGTAGIREREGMNLGKNAWDVANSTTALRENNAQNALAALGGKTGFYSGIAGMQIGKGAALAENEKAYDPYAFAASVMPNFTPVKLPAGSSTPLGGSNTTTIKKKKLSAGQEYNLQPGGWAKGAYPYA